jgi:hypothetical protein
MDSTNIPYSGQYLARFDADGKPGSLMINVDRDRAGKGWASLHFDNSAFAFIVFNCVVFVENGILTGSATRSYERERFYGRNEPQDQEVTTPIKFQLNQNQTPNSLQYETTDGSRELILHQVHQVRVEAIKIATWQEFKSWVETIHLQDKKAVFRGMAKSSFELKTSFHRTGRVDLERYRDVDLSVFSD